MMKYELFQIETRKNTEHRNKQPTNKQKPTSGIIMTNCLMTAIMSSMQPKRVPFISTKCTVRSNLISFTERGDAANFHMAYSAVVHLLQPLSSAFRCTQTTKTFLVRFERGNYVLFICQTETNEFVYRTCVDRMHTATVQIRASSFIFHYFWNEAQELHRTTRKWENKQKNWLLQRRAQVT